MKEIKIDGVISPMADLAIQKNMERIGKSMMIKNYIDILNTLYELKEISYTDYTIRLKELMTDTESFIR